MSEWIRITYEIVCPADTSIERLSREIALEQTVEIPEECIDSTKIREQIVGQVMEIRPVPASDRIYTVVIAYHQEITAYQIPQFLNLLFGNISLKNNIKLLDVELPLEWLRRFKGPNFGVPGLRKLLGVYDRPLAATALKPLGSDPEHFAHQAEAFVLGGGDIIKDDHGLADQGFCPFQTRVARCQEAVAAANAKTGRRALYFPNIIGNAEQIHAQMDYVLAQGVQGVLLSPFLIGPDTLRHLAATYPVVFMTHPAFTGAHFHDPQHGIKPALLLGTLFRLLGADVSVFPNSGGRFAFTPQECRELHERLARPLGHMAPAFAAPAGGMRLDNIGTMAQVYGTDAVYLIGGALLKHSADLRKSTEAFMERISRHFQERLDEPATDSLSACEFSSPGRSAGVLDHMAFAFPGQWQGREPQAYKEKGDDFQGVTRHELVGTHGEQTAFDLRYFEIEPGGFTSLEQHRHEHVIVGVQGCGILRLDQRRITIQPHDVAYVLPRQTHQLRNESDQPFGFFCIVDHERDRPRIVKTPNL